MPMFMAMVKGHVKGMLCIGQNPATSLNAGLERQGLRNLEWLVVKDNFITETASFWNKAPETVSEDIKTEDIQTEVFFFPSAQIAELEGSFTNTQRLLHPWLTELMPELFVEISPELAAEKGIYNTQRVRISTPRGRIQARALVTGRMRPFVIGGKRIHQVGMPWHWGWRGVVVGEVVNQLTALIGDPNVSIHEAKAFVCNVEKAL